MERISTPERSKYATWLAVAALCLTCLVAFGLMLPYLGFYWDDWPFIYLLKTSGLEGIKSLLAYDRPLSLWMYGLTNVLAGTSPLKRQILALIIRFLLVISYWLTLKKVFRGKDVPVTWMALLFAVYPLFFQQSIATAYTHHFIVYILFSLSIYFMLESIDQARFLIPLQGLGLLSFLMNIVSMEYFLGLEFIRPLILWIVLGRNETRPKYRLVKLLKVWAPYLVIFCVFVVYRLYFLQLPENTNPPVLLYDFAKQPFQTVLVLLQGFGHDMITCIFTSWEKVLPTEAIDLFDRSSMLIWLAGLCLAGIVFTLMGRLEEGTDLTREEQPQPGWIKSALLIGLVAISLGMLPFWVGGKHLGVGSYSDRVALPAMFGAAIVVVCLVYGLFKPGWPRRIALSLMVGLAAAAQVRAADGYRLDWEKQVRFAWQLHWRAPAIHPNTLIVSDDSLFKYVTDYSLAAMLSTLYPGERATKGLPVWFLEADDAFETRGKNSETYIQGVDIQRTMRSLTFSGLSKDSLVVDFHQDKHCLWVVGPEDVNNLDLPLLTRELAPATNFSRIQSEGVSSLPPPEIFGSEPAPDWCTYYEKAELARQMEKWAVVISLWSEASRKGFAPNHPYERLVFVEGYAHQGDWQAAYDMSREAYRRQISLQAPLCAIWEGSLSESVVGARRDELWADLKGRLKCP